MINKLLMKFKDNNIFKNKNNKLKKDKKMINKIIIRWNKKIKWKRLIIRMKNKRNELENIMKNVIFCLLIYLYRQIERY